jgi:hypothetical protein
MKDGLRFEENAHLYVIEDGAIDNLYKDPHAGRMPVFTDRKMCLRVLHALSNETLLSFPETKHKNYLL